VLFFTVYGFPVTCVTIKKMKKMLVLLEKRVTNARKDKAKSGAQEKPEPELRRVSLGVTIPTTFAAAVVVGVVIGYALDRWLGSGPWLTLLFLILGIAAGVREMIHVLKKMDE